MKRSTTILQHCPACGNEIIPPRASMSRYAEIFICSDCGVHEAMKGFFWRAKYTTEHPTQPKGYNPWSV